MDIIVHPLKFNTNHGTIIFNIWDMPGQTILDNLKKQHYSGSDGTIIMFDLTCKDTYNSLSDLHKDVTESVGNKPIIIFGNKYDLKNKMKPKRITYHLKKSLKYTEVSAKSNYHFDKPFLYLAKKFLGQDTQFVRVPNLYTPIKN